MNFLFNEKESERVISRINHLTPDSRANWGKMSVSQMLAHCQEPLKLALGKATFKRNIFGILFGKLAKKTVVNDQPFRRNLPTAPSFIVKDHRSFEVEKSKLIELIQLFTTGGVAGLTKDPHPFFGPLTTEEWNKSQWKHLDHHLNQFGV